MGVPGNANTLLLKSAAAGGAYEISRSLRFNSGDSAYLNRTPASAGNLTKWTLSLWIKRSKLASAIYLFPCSDYSSTSTIIEIGVNDKITYYNYASGAYNGNLVTAQVFRDPSAWQHLVFVWDTNNATSSDRMQMYANGTRITAFDTATYPSSGAQSRINSNVLHTIGGGNNANYFNGYLADIHFIDGQALDPSSFTTTDLTTGQLVPKAFTGSYGTNGFKLSFSDNSTTAALGTDTSGNGNTWTVNNFSVTAGSGNDSLVDTPTSYGTDTGAGGEVRGNYCTLNPLDNPDNTLSNGNLDLVGVGSNFHGTRSTFGLTSGKWYFECTVAAEGGETRTGPGLYRPTDVLTGDYGNGTVVVYDYESNIYVRDESGSGSTWYSTPGTVSAGDIFGFAFDLDAQKVWIHKNGTWLNSGNPGAGTGAVVSSLPVATYFPGGWAYNTSDNLVFNFGQRAFAYNSNRSGFKAVCDTNLPAPVVAKPDESFQTILYTGTGAVRSITGLNFSPDLVWLKGRNSGSNHFLFDILRGPGNRICSSGTFSESFEVNSLTSFDSNGFSYGNDSGSGGGNVNGTTYVGWTWDAGTSTVTNTAGSITSQVRANASAGFSVVTWTGTGSAATVGHGLGIAPHMAIIKRRDASGWDWPVWHNKLTSSTYNIFLNSTNAEANRSDIWSAAPTSALLNLGNSGQVNGSSGTYVGYIFAPVSGYSSFGSYVGNGSSDGPMVYTGFRPRWVLYKESSVGGSSWELIDAARNPYNASNARLFPDSSGAENTAQNALDLLSNGFKPRATYGGNNSSGQTYIYAAFAESPFQYARAR